MIEALRSRRGPVEPARDRVAGMARDSGRRRNTRALDAQACDLIELPSRAAKPAVRSPRVCAERAPADCAPVPLPSAGLCRERRSPRSGPAFHVVTPVHAIHRSGSWLKSASVYSGGEHQVLLPGSAPRYPLVSDEQPDDVSRNTSERHAQGAKSAYVRVSLSSDLAKWPVLRRPVGDPPAGDVLMQTSRRRCAPGGGWRRPTGAAAGARAGVISFRVVARRQRFWRAASTQARVPTCDGVAGQWTYSGPARPDGRHRRVCSGLAQRSVGGLPVRRLGTDGGLGEPFPRCGRQQAARFHRWGLLTGVGTEWRRAVLSFGRCDDGGAGGDRPRLCVRHARSVVRGSVLASPNEP